MYSRLRRQVMLLSAVFILGFTGFAFAETPANKIQPNDSEVSAVYVRFGPRYGYGHGYRYSPYRYRYYPRYYGGYPYYRYRYYDNSYYYNRPWGWGGGIYFR